MIREGKIKKGGQNELPTSQRPPFPGGHGYRPTSAPQNPAPPTGGSGLAPSPSDSGRDVIRQEIASALRIMADYLDGPVVSVPAVLRCAARDIENQGHR